MSRPFMASLTLSALFQHSSHSSCQCAHPYFPCILLREKTTSPHLRRTCVSAIFSKHLISEQANCTSPLIRSCDTVMTRKAPFWVPSCLHGSRHGISPLCSASSSLTQTTHRVLLYWAREPHSSLVFNPGACCPLSTAPKLSSAFQSS